MIWLYQVRFAKGGGLVCIELLDRPVADAHVLIYKSRYQSRRGWIRQRGARFGGRHLGDVSTHLRMFRVVEDTRVRKEVIEHRVTPLLVKVSVINCLSQSAKLAQNAAIVTSSNASKYLKYRLEKGLC
jgi:hypothetical protein